MMRPKRVLLVFRLNSYFENRHSVGQPKAFIYVYTVSCSTYRKGTIMLKSLLYHNPFCELVILQARWLEHG